MTGQSTHKGCRDNHKRPVVSCAEAIVCIWSVWNENDRFMCAMWASMNRSSYGWARSIESHDCALKGSMHTCVGLLPRTCLLTSSRSMKSSRSMSIPSRAHPCRRLSRLKSFARACSRVLTFRHMGARMDTRRDLLGCPYSCSLYARISSTRTNDACASNDCGIPSGTTTLPLLCNSKATVVNSNRWRVSLHTCWRVQG